MHDVAIIKSFCIEEGSQQSVYSPGLAGELTEQLRLILEPTKATRLAGEYRSGKRLAMRKVIAYIASHFRKDKIWLRRTRPDQRTYQVCPKLTHRVCRGLMT